MNFILRKIGRATPGLPVGLGLLALLLAALPACLPARKVVSLPDRPTAAAEIAPTPSRIADVPTATTAADQENDDAVVDALAKVAPVKSGEEKAQVTAMPPTAKSEPANDQIVNGPAPLLIGPLLDPLFEPKDLAAEVAQTEEQVAEESYEPLLTETLEPLNLENIPLPNPNTFGSFEGFQVDTSGIRDLAEISDPDTQYDLPVVLNEQVQFFLDQYLTSHRKIFGRWLARSGRFLPMIQEELAKAGLPQDLCYLPMIESGFRVNAYSPAKAVGAWQFIQSTGKLYGLTINKEIDERCDPIKSTQAAIRFLSDLYEDLGSWPLAIAAYNSGGGRIRTAIEKTGSTDFWELAKSRYLPPETKYYLPKLLAAIIVAKNPVKYGFDEIEYEPPMAFETVEVPKSTHLAAVALAAGTDLEEIYSLNRHLRRAITPSDIKFCRLCVPIGTSELITRNLPLVKTTYTTSFKTHVVRKGETATKVSKKYGISKKTLLKTNRLVVAKLSPGQRLQIPYQTKSYKLVARTDQRVAAKAAAEPSKESQGELIRHTVRAGESIFQLARRYNVSMEQIAAWNNLRDPRRLSVGQTLEIYRNDRNAAMTGSANGEASS